VPQVDEPLDLPEELAAVARALQTEPTTQRTLDRSVRLAVQLIPDCHFAGISIVQDDRTITTTAATDPLLMAGDELQYALGEGPGLDALWHYDTVISPDLAHDQRWPNWAPRAAAELNIASMLSLQLFTSTTVVGALNLYSTITDAFDDDALDTATALAAHVAVAVAETQHADQLHLKATSRAIIGQAQGILMERYDLDDEQAFRALRRVSQDTNTKLGHVAEELIRTRKTPGT
jgi:GAF domain-containing protein